MKLEDMIEVTHLVLVEQSYMDLADERCSYDLLAFSAEQAKVLVDEEENPLYIAIGDDSSGWLGTGFLLHAPPLPLLEMLEEMECEVFQEPRDKIKAAMCEYFSSHLLASVTPALEDLNENRVQLLRDLLFEYAEHLIGSSCLDCCCGSGVGSLVLREMGWNPLSFDNDEALLTRGFVSKRLEPSQTFCIDATKLCDFIDIPERGVDLAFGFMVGEINNFSQGVWDDILDQIFFLSKRAFLTVGTEKEARLIEEWALDAGKEVLVHENPRDILYDRWVCVVWNSE
ncbi:MAG: hypothetical protein LBV40_00475 [Methanomicrobiales archaeon]|jgi:hypothetical protein|nr:hypothetical protein [Methanomicrobiales archaeon]